MTNSHIKMAKQAIDKQKANALHCQKANELHCALCDQCHGHREFYASPLSPSGRMPICCRHLSAIEAEQRQKRAAAQLARAGIHPHSPLFMAGE